MSKTPTPGHATTPTYAAGALSSSPLSPPLFWTWALYLEFLCVSVSGVHQISVVHNTQYGTQYSTPHPLTTINNQSSATLSK